MAEVLDSPWLVAGLAFMFGLLAGWMIWGGRWKAGNGASSDDRAAERAGRELFDEEAGLEGNLATVIDEIIKTKALLEKTDEADAATAQELEKLDQAIKRANGRLKLIAKSEGRKTVED